MQSGQTTVAGSEQQADQVAVVERAELDVGEAVDLIATGEGVDEELGETARSRRAPTEEVRAGD